MTSAGSGAAQWLQSRLELITAEARPRVLSQHRATLDRAQAWLIERGCTEAAMRIGEQASDFALPNQRGKIIRLFERLTMGPVALVFFRGDWCPYCQVTLRAWNRSLNRMHAVGASVLAISPQTPEANAAMAEKLRLRFELLSDVGSEISDSFRISYPVLDEMSLLYRQFGIRLADINGGDSTRLPMPATFLIDSSGRIRLSDVQREPARRFEPADAVRIARNLTIDDRVPRSIHDEPAQALKAC